MSDVIDNKVVSMEFDNARFEKNVKTSMSTIEKLKNALNFDSSVKGLDSLSKASGKIDMSTLEKSVDAVKNRFSALEVVGITALANITNSAVNAGKRIVKELSVDQVTEGWKKYGDIITSTQTIMSATGKSVDEVDKSLERLNWFTDETSYNLVDMTSNIGKFTSAGVDLNKAVDAMQGIALEAALSGANTQQASRAMYNFSQSMGMGAVKLQDWMSIENANMATKEFKETLIETGKELGRISKSGEILKNTAPKYSGPDTVDFQNFRNTISAGWLDNEVLTTTLEKYGKFATKLQSVMDSVDLDTTSEMLRYVDQYKKGIIDLDTAASDAGVSSSKLKSILKELSSDTYELGFRAFKAGQEAKTLEEALNATKDAVSTGWMNMFKIIFGNYEEAKVLWTNLSNDLWDIFAAPINSVNSTLRGTFDSSWSQLTKEIEGTGVKMSDFEKVLKSVSKSHGITLDNEIKKYGSLEKAIAANAVPVNVVKEAFNKFVNSAKPAQKVVTKTTDDLKKFQKVVNQVIRGDFGNGEARVKALTAAGWKYSEVQNLVNKQLKNGKITLKDLSNQQLKSAGYTNDQIKALRELGDQALDSDSDISKLLDSLNRPSGRELFTDTLANGMKSLKLIIEDVKEAWSDIFPAKTSDQLYNIIKKINEFSEKTLKGLEERSDKIQRSLKGLFAILDIIGTLVGDVLNSSFKILSGLFADTGDNVLDFSADMGDSIVKFRDWLKENDKFGEFLDKFADKILELKGKVKNFTDSSELLQSFSKTCRDTMTDLPGTIEKVAGKLELFKDGIVNLYDKIKNTEFVQDAIKNVKEVFDDFIESAGDLGDKLKEIFSIFTENFKNKDDLTLENISNSIETFISNLGKLLTGTSNEISDTKWTFEDFRKALKDKLTDAGDTVETFVTRVTDAFKKIRDLAGEKVDLSDVIGLGLGIGMIASVKKLNTTLTGLSKWLELLLGPMKAVTDGIKSLSTAVNQVGGYIKSQKIADTILKVAISVGILTAAVMVLANAKDPKQMYIAAGIISLMLGILSTLFAQIAKVTKNITPESSNSLWAIAGMVTSVGASIMLIAGALKLMGSIPLDDHAIAAIGGLLVSIGSLLGTLWGVAKITNKNDIKEISNLGLAMVEIGGSLLIISGAMKILSTIKWDSTFTSAAVGMLVAVASMVGTIIALSKTLDDNNVKVITSIANSVLKIGASFILFVVALKLMESIDLNEVLPVITTLGIFAGGVGLLIGVFNTLKTVFNKLLKVTDNSKSSISDCSKNIIAIAGSLLIVVVSLKLLETVNLNDDLIKRLGVIATILGALTGVTWALSKFGGDKGGSVRAAADVVAIAASLLLVVTSMKLIQDMPVDKMVETAGTLGVLIVALGYAMGQASKIESKDSMKGIIAMMTFIGLLGGLVIAVMEIDKNTNNAIEAAGSISMLLVALGTSAAIISKYDKGFEKGVMSGLMGLLLIAAGAAAIIGVLATFGKGGDYLEKAGSISLLLLALSESAKIISKVNMDKSSLLSTFETIAMMVGASIAIAFILSSFEMNGAMEKAKAISLLLGVITGITAIFGKIDINPGFVLRGCLSMLETVLTVELAVTLTIGALVGIGYEASKHNWKSHLNTAIDLFVTVGNGIAKIITSSISTFMDGLLEICPKMEEFANSMAKVFGAFGMMGTPTSTKVLSLCLDFIETATSRKLKKVADVDELKALAGKVGEFAGALATAMGDISNLENLNQTGLTNAIDAASKIASMDIPSQGGGWKEKIFGDTSLATFAKGLTSFADAMVGLSAKVSVDGAINYEAIKTLCKAATEVSNFAGKLPVIDGGWVQKLIGDSSLTAFTNSLNPFGKAVKKLSDFVTKNANCFSDTTNLESMISYAKKVVTFAEELPPASGWVGKLAGTGDKAMDLDTFGNQLEKFGKALAKFSKEADPKNVNIDNIANGVIAMQSISEGLTESLKPEMFKDVDAKNISDVLDKVSNGISKFGKNLKDFNLEVVMKGVSAAKSIFNTDTGFIGNLALYTFEDIDGKACKDVLDKVSDGINKFGKNLKNFSLETVQNGVAAASAIFDPVSGFIPKMLVIDFASIDGKSCKDALDKVSDGVSKFNKNLKDVTATTLSARAKATGDVFDVIVRVPRNNSDLMNFSVSMDEVSASIKDFVKALKDVKVKTDVSDKIKAIVKALSDFKGMSDVLSDATKFGKNLIENIVSGMEAKQKNVTTSMTTISSSALKTAESYYSDFYKVGQNYITNISDGISKSSIVYDKVLTNGVKGATDMNEEFLAAGKGFISKISEGIKQSTITFDKVFSTAVTKARSYYNGFYSAGQYCAQGFANGMYNDQYRVTQAGTSLGNAAYNAAKRAIKSHSPSKRFYELGCYSVAGYVNAVRDNLTDVSKSGKSMGLASLEALKSAMSSAKYAFLTDADMQPTIRPVVDMSDVKAKAALVSGYFGQTGAYYRTGVQVAASMSSRSNPIYVNANQNGITKEAFNSSINSLKAEVSELKDVVRNLKIVMDTGTLVGALAPGMDKQLNSIALKKKRNI